jgi:hypothetical protein
VLRLVLTAISTFALALPASAAARPASHDCAGTITAADGTPVGVTVVRGHTSCNIAKRVLRQYLHSHAPCQGSACFRTRAGWTCSARYAADYPEVAVCTHAREKITATAIVD